MNTAATADADTASHRLPGFLQRRDRTNRLNCGSRHPVAMTAKSAFNRRHAMAIDFTAPDTWAFYASASAYFVADEPDYVQPTIAADRGRLHFEARYNYEDKDAGSAWIGYNLAAGDEFALEFTPMLGVVFGNTRGIAPGFEGSLSWRKLTLSSETQYVFDADDSDSSFLYTWSELSWAPSDRWRAGLVVQRTKVYETDFDIQRGFLAGVSLGRLDLTAYVFNPDDSPSLVIAFGAGF